MPWPAVASAPALQWVRIVASAGTTVALEPGGYHIMLMELAKPLVVGEKVKVTLTFEKAGDVVVEAEVRDNAP